MHDMFSKEIYPILKARYLMPKGDGFETPLEMLERVADHVARAESGQRIPYWRDRFLDEMTSLRFLPNSPTLMNAGKELGQLSACFVLQVNDSLNAIMNCVKDCALIHKTGGGTGFSLSRLRPTGYRISTTNGTSSGVVSFLEIFDKVTDVVKQGGVRRGANIANLKVTHPDIFEFVRAKIDGKFQNFNLSVLIPDDFMRRVITDDWHNMIWKGRVVEKCKARDLFEEIAYCAWLTGDPGVIFLDAANRSNPTPWLGKFFSTNPCGEQFLLPNQSCNLGSIDVSKFVDENGYILYIELAQTIMVAVRFLDDVINVNKFPFPKIEKKTKLTRNIGLGVMGWADLLIKIGVHYDELKAFTIAAELMEFINRCAHNESMKLGGRKGYYPAYRVGAPKMRNAMVTCIAPTGTLSMLAGCSSGIEPIYSHNFTKTVLGNVVIDYSDFYKDKDIHTALEIPYSKHIQMQTAFQQNVDNSISKTINMPSQASINDIKDAYMMAWDSNLKGITIFRDTSKAGVLQDTGLSECIGGKCVV
jgi:ribonucleoside-diphosphate reductase alpha chain